MSDAVPEDPEGSWEGLQVPHGSEGDGRESVQPSEPTATMTRADLIERVAERLIAEGSEPFTAHVLATIFATSDELSNMLAALDSAGGIPGIGGIVASMFGRKKGRT
jgi:hypothetical protein